MPLRRCPDRAERSSARNESRHIGESDEAIRRNRIQGPVNGKSAQRLFVPKLLTHAAMDYDKQTAEREQAYEIIKKWAALEASGKLLRMKETNLEGEFFADVLSTALGYTNFSQNLPQWDLKAKFPVEGQTADGSHRLLPPRTKKGDAARMALELF